MLEPNTIFLTLPNTSVFAMKCGRNARARTPGGGVLKPSPLRAMPAFMPALKIFSMRPPFSSIPAMIFFMKLPERVGTVSRKVGSASLRLMGMLRRVAMPPPRESTKYSEMPQARAVYRPTVCAKEWSTGRTSRVRKCIGLSNMTTASWQLAQ